MVHIKVHRGLEQIGGCITEIWTDTSRVFVDFGQNLPGVGKPTTEEEDARMVANIFAWNPKSHEAVFYTHGHEDHVGLMTHIPHQVPQYMSEGTKELLSIKYKAMRRLKDGEEQCTCLDRIKVWKGVALNQQPESIVVGDIRVTPYSNCHSIYDSHMFLIEAGGKRIWHTGDYREHGYRGGELIPTLKKYAAHIDVLITEGTMLNQDEACIHEREVAAKMAHVMRAFKYVFVLASSTDVERLTTIKLACNEAEKKMWIMSRTLRKTMELFTTREANYSHDLFSFNPMLYRPDLFEKIRDTGMAMVVETSQMNSVKELIEKLPQSETLLIYSAWDGYYKDPEQAKANPKYKEFRAMFNNVVDLHTSGHADRATIERVISTIKPKEVICIHKDANAKLTI